MVLIYLNVLKLDTWQACSICIFFLERKHFISSKQKKKKTENLCFCSKLKSELTQFLKHNQSQTVGWKNNGSIWRKQADFALPESKQSRKQINTVSAETPNASLLHNSTEFIASVIWDWVSIHGFFPLCAAKQKNSVKRGNELCGL